MGKNKKVENISAGLVAAGAGTYGVSKVRERYQKKIDPNKVLIRGGTYSPKGVPEAKTVFNVQRQSWVKTFTEGGVKVEEKADYKMPKYKPGTYHLSGEKAGKPIAEIHVGRHPKKPYLGVMADRILKGKTTYRQFTDFGPGNLVTGNRYLGLKNWMKAPKGPIYTRNIVPGGDVVKTPKAQKPNINVSSIPVSKAFSKEVVKPLKSKKKVISLYGGTGYVWPKALPQGGKDIDKIVKALDVHYGKEKYNLKILGGPLVGRFDKTFREAAKKHKSINYMQRTDAPGVKKFFTSSHVSIAAPGSTLAELASIKGYKPKIIGLGLKGEKHFKTNVEWFEKKVGGATFYDLSKGHDTDALVKKLKEIDKLKEPSKKPVMAGKVDIEKIISTAKKDLQSSKKFTRNLRRGGKILAGLGAAGVASSYLLKQAAKKKNILKDETTKGVAVSSAAAFSIRAAENKLHDISSRKVDFASFDEVKKYYKDVKKGDIVFFKDSFARGKGHPVVVTSTSHFDWPDDKGWKKGIRSKKVLPDAPIDPKRPYRGKGKIMEAYPGSTVAREGSLEGKLFQTSHVSEKYVDPSTKKMSERQVFSRKHARELGAIHRYPDLDPKKLTKLEKTVQTKMKQGKVKYSPFAFKTKFKKDCVVKGTCVTFAHGLTEQARKVPVSKKVIMPAELAKVMPVLKKARTPSLGKSNFFAPVLVAEGLMRTYKGLKKDDATDTLTGAATTAVGVASNVSKRVSSAINVGGGFAAQATGGMLLETPAIIKDVIKRKTMSDPTSAVQATRKFLRRHKGLSKGVGTVALGIPAIYGIHKGLNKLQKEMNKK